MPRAFEKCTALRHLDPGQSEYSPANLTRCLPECFLEAEITVPASKLHMGWTCGLRLSAIRLPHKLRIIELEAFLKCTSLKEVSVPPHCFVLQDVPSPAAHSSANFKEQENA